MDRRERKFGRNVHTEKPTDWRQLLYCATADPLQRRHGQLLAGILLGLLGVTGFSLIRGVFDPFRPLAVQLILGAMVVSTGALYGLNRRGRVRAASAGLTLLGVMCITGLCMVGTAESAGPLPLPGLINPFGLIIPLGMAGVFLPARFTPLLVLLVSLDSAWIYTAGAPSLAVFRTTHPDQVSFLIVNTIILYIVVGFFSGAGSYLVNQALRDAHHANQNLSLAQAQERRRIIRELHDGPLQEIVGMMHLAEQCDILLAEGETARAQALLAVCAARGDLVVRQIRTLVRDLRPQELANTPLPVALHQLGERLQATGISVTLDFALTAALPPTLETALFRMVQEGLTNVHKHARAPRVWVTLEETAHAIQLEIRDDGQGFTPDQLIHQPSIDHMGLENLAARTAELGGHLSIQSAPGHGTTLQMTLPLPATPDAEPSRANTQVTPRL